MNSLNDGQHGIPGLGRSTCDEKMQVVSEKQKIAPNPGIYKEVESLGEPDEENQGLDAVGHTDFGQQKM